MRKLSLFNGIGGIDLAAHWAGMETVAFCERELFPQKVLRKHWPNVPIYDDVSTLTAKRLEEDGIIGPGRTIDAISAGYPCQPESTAGKRKGKEDDRWLWPEVRRLIKEIRPRWFIGENVFGHVSLGLDTVLSDLEDDGYTAEAIVIPAAAVGAPHRRDRVIVLGYTECIRCCRESRGRTGKVTKDRHLELEKGVMGNSTSKGFQEWRQPELSPSRQKTRTWMEPEFERSGEDVADTKSERSRKEREHQCRRSEEWFAGGGEALAYPASVGQQGQRESFKSYNSTQSGEGKASESLNVCIRTERTIESRLGGVLDGLSSWVDQYRWPAGIGQPQFDWEPPRVATGVKDRVGRLKALGNAVNPVQIYPVLAAIKAINDELSRMEAYSCLYPEQEGTSW